MMARLDPLVARARNLVAPHLADGAIVAVSGGADSLALAAVVAFFVERRGINARAVIVDHQLQSGSAEVAARAADECTRLGLPASVHRVEVEAQGPGLEGAAREARYRLLRAEAGSAPILVAHTLDDQAETVLLGLGRGSGPNAISGMRPVRGQVHRPFLALRRSETEHICRVYDLDWWNDPHNDDPAFRRVRVRREVMPLLEDALGGGVAEALARTADLVRQDSDALDALADAAMPESDHIADVTAFALLDRAVRTRVWRRLAIRAGALAGELSHAHTESLDSLLTAPGGTQVQLPGFLVAIRRNDRVEFTVSR